MKKILITTCCMALCTMLYAQDRYFVEVDINTKANMSDYILKDGDELEKLSADRVLIEFATLEEYLEACAGATWETKWANWKKTQANVDKINLAIANKPMTAEEELADLKARLEVLEAKEVTP